MKKKVVALLVIALSLCVLFVATWIWVTLSLINDRLDDNSSLFKITTALSCSLFDKHEASLPNTISEPTSLMLALIDKKSECAIYAYKREKDLNKYYQNDSAHDPRVDIGQSLDRVRLNRSEIRDRVDDLREMKSIHGNADYFNKRIHGDIGSEEMSLERMATRESPYEWYIRMAIAYFDKQERRRYFSLDDGDRLLLAIISVHFKMILLEELELTGELGQEGLRGQTLERLERQSMTINVMSNHLDNVYEITLARRAGFFLLCGVFIVTYLHYYKQWLKWSHSSARRIVLFCVFSSFFFHILIFFILLWKRLDRG